MDKFRKFQESFISHFKSLYRAMKGKSGKELDEALIQQAKSNEQKMIIQETCQDVDREHDMIEEMTHSAKTPGEFLERDIIETVKIVHPDATDGEVDQVVEAVMDAMEKEIEHDANELSNETSMLSDVLQTKTESKEGK